MGQFVVVDTTWSGPWIGGGHLFVPRLAAGLVTGGHQVHLVGPGRVHPRLAPLVEQCGAEVHFDLWRPGTPIEDARRVLASWVNQLRPDAYVISTSGDVGWAALPWMDPSIPRLAVVHNDVDAYYVPVRHYRRWLTQAIAVSPEICLTIVDKCGYDPDAVAWVPYGVPQGPRPLPRNGRLNLIYCSRLIDGQKRSLDVIRLVEELRARPVDYRLTVVGDGPLREEFETRLTPEFREGRVELRGWCEPAAVYAALAESDVFLMTSEYEGFSIALTEALAHGVLPLVTDIRSGNRYLIRDGENGFLVPVGDVAGFVSRIQTIAGDRGRLQALRMAAWVTGQAYTTTRMVESYLDCIETAARLTREESRTPDPAFPLMSTCRSCYPVWLRRLYAAVRPEREWKDPRRETAGAARSRS